MGDNLFQNAADEGTQLGQANVKSLQTGADMMGDIFEKTADSNLKKAKIKDNNKNFLMILKI